MSTSRINPKERLIAEKPNPSPLPAEGAVPAAPKITLVGGLLWMVFGPMMLFLSTVALIIKAERFFTLTDVYYLFALGSIVAGRWLEFHGGGAQSSDGKPLSARALCRSSLLLGVGGLILWLIASMIRLAVGLFSGR
jgi:hypothetical protein